MVTFEIALAIPLLMLVVLAAFWLLRLGQLQAQVQDAARSAAREAARGAPGGLVEDAARQVLPGVHIDVHEGAGSWVVRARYQAEAPGGVLGGLDRELEASTEAAKEDSDVG